MEVFNHCLVNLFESVDGRQNQNIKTMMDGIDEGDVCAGSTKTKVK
jgi:hypothetical protein